MFVVGLTGGIGSGKSAAGKFFAELNITVIDADGIAKELLTLPDINQKVIEHFGPKVCDRKGTLNRYLLREVIFNDAKQRHWLEALLHPLIRARIKDLIAKSTSPYTVVMIPLLVETQKEDYVHRILVLDVPESVQISRITNRDGITLDEAQLMLAAQTPRKNRLTMADDVIDNTDTLMALKNKILGLHDCYLQIARKNKKI